MIQEICRSALQFRTARWPLVLGALLAAGVASFASARTLDVAAGEPGPVRVVTLDETNWDLVPDGKEVDANYGDLLIMNGRVKAVIAFPSPLRNANMTVQGVGGCLIDFTTTRHPNDQLSCFYPGARNVRFSSAIEVVADSSNVEPVPVEIDTGIRIATFDATGESVCVKFRGRMDGGIEVRLTYRLDRDDGHLTIESEYSNQGRAPFDEAFFDSIRADNTFEFGVENDGHYLWAYDPWFNQAYGFEAKLDGDQLQCNKVKVNNSILWRYAILDDGEANLLPPLQPGDSRQIVRTIGVHEDRFQLHDLMTASRDKIPADGSARRGRVGVQITDADGAVSDALLTLSRSDETLRTSRLGRAGLTEMSLEPGEYVLSVNAPGRPTAEKSVDVKSNTSQQVVFELESLGKVDLSVQDQATRSGIPCKVNFYGVDGTDDPDFGPDSRAFAMKNICYCANGKILQSVPPGKYELIISRGPEYNAEARTIEVKRGEVTPVTATLEHVVDSRGWVSAELHSHSSPSGDNTCEQLGRVLNLLAEHIEFGPCTEHNRIDSYVPHLEELDAVGLMATCPGMELTGKPLPINHQNAFPLEFHPCRQDGGGPQIDTNPLTQIKRLRMWDDESEKLVQMNHPNLVTIYGDRDDDGQADGGFRKMLEFVDVVEIHPPETILTPETELPRAGSRGNVAFNWLQLLNQGVKVPGVVNTDAHYNFHGSGWLRNWIRSSTDAPSEIDIMEMVRNCKAGQIVMSNAPFLTATITASNGKADEVVGPGETSVIGVRDVQLDVKVQCANWYDINRVQVFVNGRMREDLNFTRREHPEVFEQGVVKFNQTINLDLKGDAHVIVCAVGEGLKLGRVMGPEGDRPPIAITNPVWVDVDGGGVQPNLDRLDAPFLAGDE